MSTGHTTTRTYLRPLASGTVIHVDAATGRPLGPATPIPAGCPEFFMVPSGHPEPDCEADCWRETTCDAPMFETYGNPNGRTCTDGHTYGGIEVEWAVDGIIESMERTVGRECTPDEYAQLRDLVS
jgi:hypothetical protein